MFIFARPNRVVRPFSIFVAAGALFTLVACSSSSPTADSLEEEGTRVYESAFGSVELPETIERIVSVDFYTPAALVDLGVAPVGVVNSYFTEGTAIPEQYKTAVEESGAVSIGEYYEISPEAVAQAEPDLIVATSDFLPLEDPLREQLEKIAPILTFEARDGESWRTRAVALAEILDKEENIQTLVDEYDARRDEIAAEYADVLADNAFAVVVPVADEWGTYADTHFATPILRDLGATFREQQDDEINEAKFPNWFSYEELGRLSNADVIFTVVSDDAVTDMLEKNLLWQSLPATQNGLVFDYIPLSPTGSYGWALENLADLETLLAQVQEKGDAQN